MKTVQALAVAGTMMLASGSIFADGKSDYESKCAACHGFGVAGAPKFGDPAAWTDRIGKGMDALYENAIKGYTGEAGVMPPKGGFAALTDDEVKAIVDYMVEQSQ